MEGSWDRDKVGVGLRALNVAERRHRLVCFPTAKSAKIAKLEEGKGKPRETHFNLNFAFQLQFLRPPWLFVQMEV